MIKVNIKTNYEVSQDWQDRAKKVAIMILSKNGKKDEVKVKRFEDEQVNNLRSPSKPYQT